MNKARIAQLFIIQLELQIAKCKASLEETHSLINESPSANQSHSDTSRYQLTNVAQGQESRLIEIKETAQILKNLDLSSQDMIAVGTVFALRENDIEIKYYFMFPKAQGDHIEIDGLIITAVSFQSPIGISVLGKKRGDKLKTTFSKIEIVDIW